MDQKILFALAMELILSGVLISSWYFGKDGIITTAIIGLMGMIAGTMLGFKFGAQGS
jgi:hypothetical protein